MTKFIVLKTAHLAQILALISLFTSATVAASKPLIEGSTNQQTKLSDRTKELAEQTSARYQPAAINFLAELVSFETN